MAFFLYTETAFHHEGDVDFLNGLVKASKDCGAEGIKFQMLLDYDSFIATTHPGYSGFKKALLSKEEWLGILKRTKDLGLKMIVMPCDLLSIDVVMESGIKPDYFDIHSVSFHDKKLLQKIKETNIPVILGIGGRYNEEVQEKIDFFKDQLKVLMIGFQSFPTKLEDVVFEKIPYFKKKFPNLSIGYADHSMVGSQDAIIANEWAYTLGARVFEKHITTHPYDKRFDWESAAPEDDFKLIAQKLKRLDEFILNKPKDLIEKLTEKEKVYREREKVAVAGRPLEKGEILQKDNVEFKMTGVEGGIGINEIEQYYDKKINSSMAIDEIIRVDNIII